MGPTVSYKAAIMSMIDFSIAIDAELPTPSTCMHQPPVVPRQKQYRINTIDAGAEWLTDSAYVQLSKETFHPQLATSKQESK